MSYIRFVKRLGSRDAVSRRFFVIFQYEAPTNERYISYAEIVSCNGTCTAVRLFNKV